MMRISEGVCACLRRHGLWDIRRVALRAWARRGAATGPTEPCFGAAEAFSANASSPTPVARKSSAAGPEMAKSERSAAAPEPGVGSAAPIRAASAVVSVWAWGEEVGTSSAASAGFSAGEGAAGAANGADVGAGAVCGVPLGCIHSAPTKTAAPAAALHHKGERRRSRGRCSAAARPARKRSHAASLG